MQMVIFVVQCTSKSCNDATRHNKLSVSLRLAISLANDMNFFIIIFSASVKESFSEFHYLTFM